MSIVQQYWYFIQIQFSVLSTAEKITIKIKIENTKQWD